MKRSARRVGRLSLVPPTRRASTLKPLARHPHLPRQASYSHLTQWCTSAVGSDRPESPEQPGSSNLFGQPARPVRVRLVACLPFSDTRLRSSRFQPVAKWSRNRGRRSRGSRQPCNWSARDQGRRQHLPLCFRGRRLSCQTREKFKTHFGRHNRSACTSERPGRSPDQGRLPVPAAWGNIPIGEARRGPQRSLRSASSISDAPARPPCVRLTFAK